jgi:hypothetical protein
VQSSFNAIESRHFRGSQRELMGSLEIKRIFDPFKIIFMPGFSFWKKYLYDALINLKKIYWNVVSAKE